MVGEKNPQRIGAGIGKNGIKAHSISEENTATKNTRVRRQVEQSLLPIKAYKVATK
jgi:hypothetical protein